MKCSLLLLALGLASTADAFFFPFFGKGKGGQSHKYPGPHKVPSHYGPPRPRPPIRPTLTYGPPRPVTTYGPPNVRPRPPSTSYGPPSKGGGKGHGGYPSGTTGGHGGSKGDGGYPGSGGHGGGSGNGGYPGGNGGGHGGGKGNGGYPGGTGGGHGGGKGNGGYPGGTGGGYGGGKGDGGYPGGTGGGHGGGKGNGGYPGTSGGGHGGYPGGSGGHGGGTSVGGYPGNAGGSHGGGSSSGGGHGGGSGSGGYPSGTGGGHGGGSSTSGGHGGGSGTAGYPGGPGGGHGGGSGTGGGHGGGSGSGGYVVSGGGGYGGSLNHHTHYHSHYHSTSVGLDGVPLATLAAGLSGSLSGLGSLTAGQSASASLTLSRPSPALSYTTAIQSAVSASLSPSGVTRPQPRPSYTAAPIINTRAPLTATQHYLPPPQGQASDKVAIYLTPEGSLAGEAIEPRGAGRRDDDVSTNQVTARLKTVPRLSGPGVEQQGPQVPLEETASRPQAVTAQLVQLEPPAARQQQQQRETAAEAGLAERLRQLGLLRFLALVERAGLEKVLQSRGGVTLFAFTDEAWALLPYSLRRQLTADPERLRHLLLHHVTPLAVPPTAFNDNMVLKSASPSGAALRVNIYQMSRFSERVVTVNGAQVLRSDDSAPGGVVHVLDRALVAEAVLDALQYVTTQQCADLDFSGISNMLTKLGVSALLSQRAPLTLFLPISAAFSDPDSLANDFSNSTTVMQNSLLYHIVPGAFYSAGLRDGQWLETLLDGQELQLQVVTDGYSRRLSTVSKQAQVIRADIPVSNGVIHIVDFVLRPERNLQRCDVRR